MNIWFMCFTHMVTKFGLQPCEGLFFVAKYRVSLIELAYFLVHFHGKCLVSMETLTWHLK